MIFQTEHRCICSYGIRDCYICKHFIQFKIKRLKQLVYGKSGYCDKEETLISPSIIEKSRMKCSEWELPEDKCKKFIWYKLKFIEYHDCYCDSCKTERMFDKAISNKERQQFTQFPHLVPHQRYSIGGEIVCEVP